MAGCCMHPSRWVARSRRRRRQRRRRLAWPAWPAGCTERREPSDHIGRPLVTYGTLNVLWRGPDRAEEIARGHVDPSASYGQRHIGTGAWQSPLDACVRAGGLPRRGARGGGSPPLRSAARPPVDNAAPPQEYERFLRAGKDPEFVKLFQDYAAEISDPHVRGAAAGARERGAVQLGRGGACVRGAQRAHGAQARTAAWPPRRPAPQRMRPPPHAPGVLKRRRPGPRRRRTCASSRPRGAPRRFTEQACSWWCRRPRW
jgi:hypothetical protein